jgi:hypothetical protein
VNAEAPYRLSFLRLETWSLRPQIKKGARRRLSNA